MRGPTFGILTLWLLSKWMRNRELFAQEMKNGTSGSVENYSEDENTVEVEMEKDGCTNNDFNNTGANLKCSSGFQSQNKVRFTNGDMENSPCNL